MKRKILIRCTEVVEKLVALTREWGVIADIFWGWLEAGKAVWEVQGLPRQEYR